MDSERHIKCRSFDGEQTAVYVHTFHKFPAASLNAQNHQRGKSNGFYEANTDEAFRKQFKSMSLNTRNSMPKKLTKSSKKATLTRLKAEPYPKIFSHNPLSVEKHLDSAINNSMYRYDVFCPEAKAAFDKLEESYWTNWKHVNTSKAQKCSKSCQQDGKGDCVKDNVNFAKLQGDSEESTVICEESTELDISDSNNISSQNDIKDVGLSIQSLSPTIVIEDSDVDIPFNIKHTDSFILNYRKHIASKDKPHYQQPRRIRLFKNENLGTNVSTKHQHAKEAGHTFKSCMKSSM